jgi:hypothetical protein
MRRCPRLALNRRRCFANVRFAPQAAILERPAFVSKRRSHSTADLIGFTNEDAHAARSPVSKAKRSIIEVVVFDPWYPGGRALQELPHDDAARGILLLGGDRFCPRTASAAATSSCLSLSQTQSD